MSAKTYNHINANDLTIMTVKQHKLYINQNLSNKYISILVMSHKYLNDINPLIYQNINQHADIEPLDTLHILGYPHFDTIFFIHPEHITNGN